MDNPAQALVLEYFKLLADGDLVIFIDSAPNSGMLKKLLLKNPIFFFWLMFLDLQVPRGEAKTWLAFEIRTRISSSPSPLLDTLDPRYM